MEMCGIFPTTVPNITAQGKRWCPPPRPLPDPQNTTGGIFMRSGRDTQWETTRLHPYSHTFLGTLRKPVGLFLQPCALLRRQACGTQWRITVVWDNMLTVVHESNNPKTEPRGTPAGARKEEESHMNFISLSTNVARGVLPWFKSVLAPFPFLSLSFHKACAPTEL